MLSHGIIKKFFIDEHGRLVVNAEYQDEHNKRFESMGVFDLTQDNESFNTYAANSFWPFIRGYNFADPLKRICMDMFGLTKEQCYGTDEEKNSLTPMFWEDMPGWTPDPACPVGNYYHRAGPMTAREFMQYFGTNMCRKMNNFAHISPTMRQIKAENPELAVIGDCRFKNEIEAVHKEGGKVLYFTRNEESSDAHESEQASKSKDMCDAIIDNANMNIEEQNQAVIEHLYDWGILPRNL
jgi:hypothetical protein